MIRDYRDLLVWQRAMELVKAIYSATATFPAAEAYGLTSQIRRSAVSVPSNIAEGHGRETMVISGVFSPSRAAPSQNCRHNSSCQANWVSPMKKR
jgi:hypothetical protein